MKSLHRARFDVSITISYLLTLSENYLGARRQVFLIFLPTWPGACDLPDGGGGVFDMPPVVGNPFASDPPEL